MNGLSQMVVNMQLGKDGQVINNKSKVALTSNGTATDLKVKDLDTETRCALLANLTVSGGTGKVILTDRMVEFLFLHILSL